MGGAGVRERREGRRGEEEGGRREEEGFRKLRLRRVCPGTGLSTIN